jgi:hypothetical protein
VYENDPFPIFILGTGTWKRAQESLWLKSTTLPSTTSKVATITLSLLWA